MQLQRAMAAEAEADREARAKIIAAEGEIKASKALKEASLVMIDNPMALQVKIILIWARAVQCTSHGLNKLKLGVFRYNR